LCATHSDRRAVHIVTIVRYT